MRSGSTECSARMQAFHAVDDDARGAQPRYPRAHGDQAMAQIVDLGLARGIDDLATPVRKRCGHQRVLGRSDRGKGEFDGRALQTARRAGDHITVGQFDRGAQRFERFEMQIHRPRADGAAARQRYFGVTHARQKRAQHDEARAHLAHDVVIGRGAREVCGAEAIAAALAQRLARRPIDRNAEQPQQIGHKRHIRELGHIGEGERRIAQQASGHQRQSRILGATDGDFTLEACTAPYSDLVHIPSNGRAAQAFATRFSV